MPAPQITFYFDLLSPFSYIAFHILRTSPVFANCTIKYTPLLLLDLLQQCQNTPPIAVKNKAPWLNKERLYWSRRLNLPMCQTPPPGFPFPTSDIQSVLCVIGQQFPEKYVDVVERLYHALWAEGDSSVARSDGLRPVLEDVLGVESAEAVLDASVQEGGKERLSENTRTAFESGAFGLPWFECVSQDGEKDCFWGVDHLGRVAEFLGLDGGLDGAFRVLV
ncbi:hypothetical protein BBP40_005316 [Aspergillus hancockii]|nr:hypothetical protein BBP40_005316 [Aspergillus hancockii]